MQQRSMQKRKILDFGCYYFVCSLSILFLFFFEAEINAKQLDSVCQYTKKLCNAKNTVVAQEEYEIEQEKKKNIKLLSEINEYLLRNSPFDSKFFTNDNIKGQLYSGQLYSNFLFQMFQIVKF